MKKIIDEINQCKVCEPYLELGARPIFSVDTESRIVVIGQAPGTVVYKSGIPQDNASRNS